MLAIRLLIIFGSGVAALLVLMSIVKYIITILGERMIEEVEEEEEEEDEEED